MKQGHDHKLVVCICNGDFHASLHKRKLYEMLSDPEAEKHNQVRVIDESGEDYLYPAEYFVPVKLSKAQRRIASKGTYAHEQCG